MKIHALPINFWDRMKYFEKQAESGDLDLQEESFELAFIQTIKQVGKYPETIEEMLEFMKIMKVLLIKETNYLGT